MKLITDLHIHSRFSLATSKNLTPEYLDYWGGVKGISVVGTGDASHPAWISECEEKFTQDEGGLYVLKPEVRKDFTVSVGLEEELPLTKKSKGDVVRFMLSAEVSTIYKKDGRVRKVHHVILLPDFAAARALQKKLAVVGNITSDGRPILGLDSRNLLEIVLTVSDRALLIPAHIWTPWFSALGDKSGFDSIDECYGDLSSHITAVETGLSSDPPMNWRCGFLDRFSIISNSDAHSPEKLGREATILDCDFSYDGIIRSLDLLNAQKADASDRYGAVTGTLEFFPQEGKYHFDGHRKCGIVLNPEESARHGNICPECGKKLVLGVMNRVMALADRDECEAEELDHPNRKSFHSIIPLKEILSEIKGAGVNSRKVAEAYNRIVMKAGSEFAVLLDLPTEEIEKISDEVVAEAVRRMRRKEVYIKEGYDGEYGRITVFAPGEKPTPKRQAGLFTEQKKSSSVKTGAEHRSLKKQDKIDEAASPGIKQIAPLPAYTKADKPAAEVETLSLSGPNDEQKLAIRYGIEMEKAGGPLLIIAGPGTGKTRTLSLRIAALISESHIDPSSILALTFTVKAAREMSERIESALHDREKASLVTSSTFHSFGRMILSEHYGKAMRREGFSVLSETERFLFLSSIPALHPNIKADIKRLSRCVTAYKQKLKEPHDLVEADEMKEEYGIYEKLLIEKNAFDFDDLMFQPIRIMRTYPEVLESVRKRFKYIFIDEYQDVNEAQYILVRLLSPDDDSSLCVIGDPDQSIYGFRGSNPRFISQFVSDYPKAAVFKLTVTYRCSDKIIEAAQDVIGSRGLVSLKKGKPIGRIFHSTGKSEAEWIARTIEQMTGGVRFFSMDSGVSSGEDEDYSIGDFAILVRLSDQMENIEKALSDHGIPYQEIGDTSWVSLEPLPVILSLLALTDNPDETLFQGIKLPAGISIDWTHFQTIVQETGNLSLDKRISQIVNRFFPDIRRTHAGYLKKLSKAATMYGKSADLVSALSPEQGDAFSRSAESVALMTIHASKGLEFPVVFMAGCDDGILPFTLFNSSQEHIEEEKRLFYVAMTRAERELFISSSESASLAGRKAALKPSRFIDRIRSTHLQKIAFDIKVKTKQLQYDLFE